MNPDSSSFDTLAIRSGHRRSPELEHSEPIFATSSFIFENAAQAAARFAAEAGARWLALAVTEANVPANRLYDGLGMTVAGRDARSRENIPKTAMRFLAMGEKAVAAVL